jgi:hypothetical protein
MKSVIARLDKDCGTSYSACFQMASEIPELSRLITDGVTLFAGKDRHLESVQLFYFEIFQILYLSKKRERI